VIDAQTLKIEWEFRGFVTANELRCVTYYYKHYTCDALWKAKEQISSLIMQFWRSEIHPRLAPMYHSYTVDFSIDLEKNCVHVVEINPPPPISSTVLFDWEDEIDRSIILNGPYQLRIPSPSPDATKKMKFALLDSSPILVNFIEQKTNVKF
jgi:hypothetical protein